MHYRKLHSPEKNGTPAGGDRYKPHKVLIKFIKNSLSLSRFGADKILQQ